MGIFLLVVSLILFVGLVVVHEWGHFLMARRGHVDVEEFGIGFPPRAWSKKMKSGFVFSVNWLPLGGFVKLKGEHDSDREKGSYGAASLAVKVRIMIAGVVMNLVSAFVLFTLLALVGMPELLQGQFTVSSNAHIAKQAVLVGYIDPSSPAAKAGLKVRDQLISIGAPGQKPLTVTRSDELPLITKQFASQAVVVSYIRNGKSMQTVATFLSSAEVISSQKTSSPKGYLGVSPTDLTLKRYTWAAPEVAIGTMWQLTTATFHGLGTALSAVFHGQGAKASQQVSGPVGIFVLLKAGSLLGYQYMLMIIAVISLTLAIMNVLPIPALDGGRLFLTLITRALRVPLSQAVEERVYGVGFALLMLLIIVITVVDVKRYF